MNDDITGDPSQTRPALRRAIASRDDEISALNKFLCAANDRSNYFEDAWLAAKRDAERYAFAKTIEGQAVTVWAFCEPGGDLDAALDKAMEDDAE